MCLLPDDILISGSIPDNEAGAAEWKAEFKHPSEQEKDFKNPSDPVDDPVADWNLHSWLHHSLLTGSGRRGGTTYAARHIQAEKWIYESRDSFCGRN